MNKLYEHSKTYQYRKVMKPLLERKRRARINKCLDDLKDLIAEQIQQQNNDANVKLEKADILELAVKHLRKVKTLNVVNQRASRGCAIESNSFRSGYIRAADEVSRYLASLPKADISLGTTLMTHLGLRLNQIQNHYQPLTPLDMFSSSYSNNSLKEKSLYSPNSSGYGSDNDSSSSSFQRYSPSFHQEASSDNNIWRPW